MNYNIFCYVSKKKQIALTKKNEIKLLNNQIEATYKKNNYEINGNGKILYQNTKDDISYFLNKKKEKINFRTKLNIKDDNFKIDFLNYLKDYPF